MKVTIRKIAEIAKVSRGTVDKVFNNRPGVSQEVREKVKKIAEELGYKPNLAGKALAFQKNPLKIGVIILNKRDYNFMEAYKGAKSAAAELKDFGVTVTYRIMNDVDVYEQLKCIKGLHDEKVNALALTPLDEEIIREELKKLTDENIKIVTFNTDISGVERLCYVGQNVHKSGRVAGELLGKLLPNGGQVAIITGPREIEALQERINGFEEIVKNEYSNIKIVDIVKDVYSNESSYQKTVELFNKYNSLNAIFITGRGVGGVGKAICDLNKKDVKFICFDTVPETVKLIKDKIVDFTITQDPFSEGYLPIKILFEYFFQNKIPSQEKIYTKLEIKTKENIDI